MAGPSLAPGRWLGYRELCCKGPGRAQAMPRRNQQRRFRPSCGPLQFNNVLIAVRICHRGVRHPAQRAMGTGVLLIPGLDCPGPADCTWRLFPALLYFWKPPPVGVYFARPSPGPAAIRRARPGLPLAGLVNPNRDHQRAPREALFSGHGLSHPPLLPVSRCGSTYVADASLVARARPLRCGSRPCQAGAAGP